MSGLDAQWIPRPRSHEVSIWLVFLGSGLTVMTYIVAMVFSMAYRSSAIQDWAIIIMGFGPPLVYIATAIIAVIKIRRHAQAWPVALASCAAPPLLALLGIGMLYLGAAAPAA